MVLIRARTPGQSDVLNKNISDCPGVRALIKTMESVNFGESWTIYIKKVYTHGGHLLHHAEGPTILTE